MRLLSPCLVLLCITLLTSGVWAQFGLPLINVALHARSVNNNARVQLSPLSSLALPFTSSTLDTAIITNTISLADGDDILNFWLIIENKGTHNAYATTVQIALPPFMSLTSATPASVTDGNGNTASGYTGDLSSGLILVFTPPRSELGDNIWVVSFSASVSNTATSGISGDMVASVTFYSVSPGSDNLVLTPPSSTVAVRLATATPLSFLLASNQQQNGKELPPSPFQNDPVLGPDETVNITIIVRVPEGNTDRISTSLQGLANVGQRAHAGSCAGLYGEFFDNVNFAGTPVINISRTIDFTFNNVRPPGLPAGFPSSYFTGRWTGCLLNEQAVDRNIRLFVTVDDWVNLYYGGNHVLQFWTCCAANRIVDIILPASSCVPLVMEWGQAGGAGYTRLAWNPNGHSGSSGTIIPTSNLRYACNSTDGISLVSATAIPSASISVGTISVNSSTGVINLNSIRNNPDGVNENDFLNITYVLKAGVNALPSDSSAVSPISLNTSVSNGGSDVFSVPVRLGESAPTFDVATIYSNAISPVNSLVTIIPGEVVVLSAAVSPSLKCVQGLVGDDIGLVCESGVISDITVATYGSYRPACTRGVLNATLLGRTCNSQTIYREPLITNCLGRRNCRQRLTSAYGNPCGGGNKWVTVSYRCNFAATSAVDVSISATLENQLSSIQSINGTPSPVFDAGTGALTLPTIPFMSPASQPMLNVSFIGSQTAEMGSTILHTFFVRYRRFPAGPIEAVAIPKYFGIGTPTWWNNGQQWPTMTAKFTSIWISRSPFIWAMSPEEEVTAAFEFRMTAGFTSNVNFTIDIPSPVGWVNMSSITITNGSLVNYGRTPFTFIDRNGDGVIDRIQWLPGNMTFNFSSAGNRFDQWRIDFRVTFRARTLATPPANGARATYDVFFGGLRWSLPFQFQFSWSESSLQTSMYCQSVSRWVPGAYVEYFTGSFMRGTSSWFTSASNPNYQKWGPDYKLIDINGGYDWGVLGPKPAIRDQFASRFRGCVVNNQTTAQNITLQYRGDDSNRFFVHDTTAEELGCCTTRNFFTVLPPNSCAPFYTETIEGGGGATNFMVMNGSTASGNHPRFPLRAYLPPGAGEEMYCDVIVAPAFPYGSPSYNLSWVMPVNLTSTTFIPGSASVWSTGTVEEITSGGAPAIRYNSSIIGQNGIGVFRFRANTALNLQAGTPWATTGRITFSTVPLPEGASAGLSRTVNTISTTSAEPILTIDFISSTRINQTIGTYSAARSAYDLAMGTIATLDATIQLYPGVHTGTNFTLQVLHKMDARVVIQSWSVVSVGDAVSTTRVAPYPGTLSNNPVVIDGFSNRLTVAFGNVTVDTSAYTSPASASQIRVRFSIVPISNSTVPTLEYNRNDDDRLFVTASVTTSTVTSSDSWAFSLVKSDLLAQNFTARAAAGIFAIGFPISYSINIRHNTSASFAPASLLALSTAHVSTNFSSSVTGTGPILTPTAEISAGRFSFPSDFGINRAWSLNWTYFANATDLECGTSVLPAATVSWVSDSSSFGVRYSIPIAPVTVAVPVPVVRSTRIVDSSTLQPVPAGSSFSFGSPITVQVELELYAARASNLQLRIDVLATKLAVTSVQQVLPPAGATTSLPRWSAVSSNIQNANNGTFFVGFGNVGYNPQAGNLRANLTVFLRLSIIDSSCAGANANLTVAVAAQSTRSGGPTGFTNASLVVVAPRTLVSSTDYVIYNCQQWALLSPIISGDGSPVFVSVPQGWVVASNSSEAYDVIQSVKATWTEIVPAGGCIITQRNVPGQTLPVGVGYFPDGSPCSIQNSQYVQFGDDTGCVRTLSSNRVLIMGPRASCDDQVNQFCDPTRLIRVTGIEPSSNDGSSTVWPTTVNVFGLPSNATAQVVTQTLLPATPVVDVVILFDLNKATDADKNFLSTGFPELCTTLTDPSGKNFAPPNIGLATVATDSAGGYIMTAVQPLTTSCAEVAASVSRISVGTVDVPSSNILAAVADIMNAQADFGWRQSAYKMVITITDNTNISFSTLGAEEIKTNIVPGFYNPNPTSAVYNAYRSYSANLPWSWTTPGVLRGSNLGNNRMINWPSNVADLISRLVFQITLAPSGDHTAVTPFIASVGASQDLSGFSLEARSTPIGSLFTVGWPASVDPEVMNVYQPTVQVLGFGAVRVIIRSNTAPISTPLVLTATQDTELAVTLDIIDRESNRIRYAILSIAGNVSAISAARRAPVPLNTWETSTTLTIRPSSGWFGTAVVTFVANDGCKNSSITTVTATFQRVNLPPTASSFNFTINEDETDPSNQRMNFAGRVSDEFDSAANLRIVVQTLPRLGSLWIPGGARITSAPRLLDAGVQALLYVPTPLTDGADSFTWTSRDTDGASSSPAVVSITINPVNHVPEVILPTNPVLARYTPGASTTFDIEVTDVDVGDSLTISMVSLGTGPWSLQSHEVYISSPCCSPTINGSGPTSGSLMSGISGGATQIITFTWDLASVANTEPFDFNFTIAVSDQVGATSAPLTIRLRVSENVPPEVITSIDQYELLEDGRSDLIDLIGRDPDYLDWETGISLIFTRLPSVGALYFRIGDEPIKAQTVYGIDKSVSSDETSLSSTFQVIYVPPPLVFGSASFTYQFMDRRLAFSRTSNIRLTIIHVNHAPTALNIDVFAVGDRTLNITNFLASDPDSMDSLRLEVLSLPSGDLRLPSGQLILETPVVASAFASSLEWMLSYRPPDYQCSETVPLTTFDFRACDNSGIEDTSCSQPATASIYVQCVNHPPYAETTNPRVVDVQQLQPTEIHLIANDRDPFDPIDTLNVTISDIDTRVDLSTGLAVGQFFVDQALTQPLRRQDIIPYPHRVYFVGYRYTFYQYPVPSTDRIDRTEERPRLGYVVQDKGGLRSATYRVDVSVVRVNQPPEYRGSINVTTDQNTPLNLFFATPSSYQDDGLVLGQNVSFFLTKTTLRGSFQVCDGNDICLPVDPAEYDAATGEIGGLYALTHPRGRCIFVPETNTFGVSYATVSLVLKDSEGALTSVNFTINVRFVNQGAVLRPLNFAGGDNGVVSMFEDGSAMLRWRVTDVDSSPSILTTSLIVRVARRQWEMFACEAPAADAVVSPTECTPGQLIGDRRNATVIVPPFITNTSSCDRPFGYPVPESAFGGCFREFRLLYRPAPTQYAVIYTQFVMVPGDLTGASVQTLTVTMSVNPVNNPPELTIPASIVAPTGSKSVGLNQDGQPISVYDFDARPVSIEQVTFEAIQGTGELEFNTTAFADRCFKDTNATLPTWVCRATISTLNKLLPTAIWTTTGTGDHDDILQITLNDLGNVGVDNNPALTSSGNITISFSTVAVVTPPPTNNALFIAIAVAAVVALVVASLAIWRFRKALSAPNDDYFALGASSISTAPDNPLYKQQTIEGRNKLYKAKELN